MHEVGSLKDFWMLKINLVHHWGKNYHFCIGSIFKARIIGTGRTWLLLFGNFVYVLFKTPKKENYVDYKKSN